VALDLDAKDWLDALVTDELGRFDAAAARARLPEEAPRPGADRDLAPAARVLVARSLRHRRDPGSRTAQAFLDLVRGHVALVLDLGLLVEDGFDLARARAAVAAALAAALGHPANALDADPGQPGGPRPRAVERAFAAAARVLRRRQYPPGDPRHGLPLFAGALAVMRRHLARVAMGALRRGHLDPEALARHRAYARRETVLLVEAVAGLVGAATGPAAAAARQARAHQYARLGIPRAELREVRRAVATPRSPEALARATPAPLRPALLEELLLVALQARLPPERAAAHAGAYALAGGLSPEQVAAAQVEAAARHDDLAAWFEVVGGAPPEWAGLAGDWEATTDQVVERVSTAVTENLEALVTEIRETGELGSLLARAAGGRKLSADERARVKGQLIDLAKAVPALAIFAAPGGMLLLPLLARLLPFNLLPSAWDRAARGKAGAAGDPDRGAGI
jgi:hypothetical protein